MPYASFSSLSKPIALRVSLPMPFSDGKMRLTTASRIANTQSPPEAWVSVPIL